MSFRGAGLPVGGGDGGLAALHHDGVTHSEGGQLSICQSAHLIIGRQGMRLRFRGRGFGERQGGRGCRAAPLFRAGPALPPLIRIESLSMRPQIHGITAVFAGLEAASFRFELCRKCIVYRGFF